MSEANNDLTLLDTFPASPYPSVMIRSAAYVYSYYYGTRTGRGWSRTR
jgi:hypothetical protein